MKINLFPVIHVHLVSENYSKLFSFQPRQQKQLTLKKKYKT